MSDDPAWRSSWRRRAQAALLGWAGYYAVAALSRTFRGVTAGFEHYDAIVAAGRQPIIAFWHGRILGGTWAFQRRGIVVITSENFDGEWIARIIQRFGFGTARGSTSRGARKALRQLVRDMAAGHPAAFTVDGPRGPARQAQPGAVWLAMVTGNPLLPIHLEADRYWTLRSWDRTQVPKPFSRVALVLGEPIDVPREADVESARRDLEAAILALEPRARELLRRDAAVPAARS